MRLLYSIFFFLIAFSGFSQNEDEVDQIYMDFDKSFYVVGERIWYKAYFLNQTQSKILHIDWYGPDGTLKTQQTLLIEDNSTIGDFLIPLDWAEGIYQMRAYTLSQLNYEPVPFFSRTFAVYNDFTEDFEESLMKTKILDEYDYSYIPVNKKVAVKINSDKDQYKRREAVNVVVEVLEQMENEGIKKEAAGKLSITVLKKKYAVDGLWDFDKHLKGVQYKRDQSQFNGQANPTEIQFKVQGKVTDPETGQALESRFLTVFIPERGEFIKVESNKAGEFEFDLPTFYGDQALQFFNLNPYQTKVPEVELLNYATNLPPRKPQKMPLARSTVSHMEYLDLVKQRRKIEALFDQRQELSIDAPKPKARQLRPDKNYDLNDFESMSDVLEFMDEIVVTTRILKKGNVSSLRLFRDDDKSRMGTAPWYMVNGFLTDNEAAVLAMPLSDVDSIAVFNTKESLVDQFNPLFLKSGVVAIYTKQNRPPDFVLDEPNRVIYEGLYYPKSFEYPIFESDKNPDFRPLIYWNPQIEVDESGKASFSFYTRDALGEFLIQLTGISKTGTLFYAEKPIFIGTE